MTAEAAPVLVVDPEEAARQRVAGFLADAYDVRTAATGEAALDAVSAGVTVVVLARDLPDMSAAELLRLFEERDPVTRVAMRCAAEPDLDVVDLPVDDVLVEPVDAARLRESVAHLRNLARYSDLLDEYYRTANSLATLAAADGSGERAGSEEFERLERRVADLRDRVIETLQAIDDYAAAFHQVEALPARASPDVAGGPFGEPADRGPQDRQ